MKGYKAFEKGLVCRGKQYAQIGSSGDSAKITSKGKYAVICCAGHNSIAKAKKEVGLLLLSGREITTAIIFLNALRPNMLMASA